MWSSSELEESGGGGGGVGGGLGSPLAMSSWRSRAASRASVRGGRFGLPVARLLRLSARVDGGVRRVRLCRRGAGLLELELLSGGVVVGMVMLGWRDAVLVLLR